jgi:hypothetical protein
MISSLVPLAATGFSLLSTVQAAPIHEATCNVTSHWPGWSRVKHAFVL